MFKISSSQLHFFLIFLLYFNSCFAADSTKVTPPIVNPVNNKSVLATGFFPQPGGNNKYFKLQITPNGGTPCVVGTTAYVVTSIYQLWAYQYGSKNAAMGEAWTWLYDCAGYNSSCSNAPNKDNSKSVFNTPAWQDDGTGHGTGYYYIGLYLWEKDTSGDQGGNIGVSYTLYCI